MRSRFLPIHVLFLLATGAVVRPAQAQHCWPTSVALLVRDEQGALIHPRELEGYAWTPERPGSDAAFDVRLLRGPPAAGLAPAGTHALVWFGRGDCRVDLDQVVLRRGGREMRLWLNVRLDTDADPGPAEYVIDTPPFAEGTFELACPLPPGRTGSPAAVGADRWRRVVEGGG